MMSWTRSAGTETQVAAMPQASLHRRHQRSADSFNDDDSLPTPQAAKAETFKNIPIEELKLNELVPAVNSTPRRLSMNGDIFPERTRSHSGGRHVKRLGRSGISKRLIFQAQSITYGDYFRFRGYENVQVLVDTIGRQLIITVDKKQVIHDEKNYYSESDSEDLDDDAELEPCGNRIRIKWDDISGLDFQHQPLGPSIVVFELRNLPAEAPKKFASNFYFLYCTKEDCERYLDKVMLQSDVRLLKLAIQSLPSWAVIVNRYSIPIYYSHKFRTIITTLVNIYIVISLIWGFYDLYKNLPIVGGALRRIIGPIVAYFEPLLHNRVVLLIPLLFTRLYAIYTNLVSPIASNLFYPVIQFFAHMILPIFQYIGSFGGRLYGLVSPITSALGFMISSFGHLFSSIGYGLYALVKVPFELAVFIKNLLAGQLHFIVTLGAGLFGGIIGIIKLLAAPISKIRAIFSLTRQPVVEAVQVTATTANQMAQMKTYYDSVKENYLNPASSLWAGFRRIVDSIIHTYHTKIKHHDVLLRRLLITFLCLVVFVALVIVIVLIV